MKVIALIPVLSASLLASACSSPTDASTTDSTAALTVTTATSSYRFDAAFIDSARVEGNVLLLHLKFGGGCRPHQFALLSSGVFLESYPVQVPMALAHHGNGDMCRALLSRTQRFDLSALRRRFLANYPGGGPMILQIREPGPEGGTESVRFEVQ